MTISDQAFRDTFKPLHIPAHYDAVDSDDDKIIYCLAQLGKGTAKQVAEKLSEIDGTIDIGGYAIIAESALNALYSKGLIKGIISGDEVCYNLSKITEANDGVVNPDLLAPGLD